MKRTILAAAAAALTALGPAAAGAGAAPADYFGAEQGCPVTYKAETISQFSTAKRPEYHTALHKWVFNDVATGFVVKPPLDWTQAPSVDALSKLHQMKFLDRLFGIADDRRLESAESFSPGEQSLAIEHAVQIVVDWAGAAAAGAVPEGEAWKQRVAGIRLPYLAYAARRAACEGRLSDADATTIRAALGRHAEVLAAEPPASTPENHKLSINFGAAMLRHYFPNDPRMVDAAAQAEDRFLAAAATAFDPIDGVWLEHSPRYHRLAFNAMQAWLDGVDADSPRVKSVRDRLLDSLGWLLLPDNRLVTFGDTSGERIADGTILAARNAGFWVAAHAGYAVHAGPDRWFGLTAQYHARQHKQADELTFDLFEAGRHVIADTGFFDKGRASVRKYQEHARAHSTLTVNGKTFDRKIHQEPYGSGIQASGQSADGWYGVQAVNPLLIAPKGLTAEQKAHSKKFKRALKKKLAARARKNVAHTRTYLYKPGELLVIADRARGAKFKLKKRTKSGKRKTVRKTFKAKFQRHFQFAPGVTATKQGNDRVDFATGELTGRALTDANAKTVASIVIGKDNPLQGYAYPLTGEVAKRPATIFSTKKRTAKLDSVTVLAYGNSPVYGVSRIGGFSNKRIQLRFKDGNGAEIGGVSVARNGAALTISQIP